MNDAQLVPASGSAGAREPDAIKLCRDCRWFTGMASCEAPQNRSGWIDLSLVDPTRESIRMTRWSASIMRGAGWFGARVSRMCGREGRWWEPKPGPRALTPSPHNPIARHK